MQFILEYQPFVWLAIAVVLIIIEAATVNLATIWFALGALVSMVLAFLDLPIVWQILLFLIISSVLLIFTRPVAVKRLKIGAVKTNAESLVGLTARAVTEINRDDKGQVKINGQIWTAIPVDETEIAADSKVVIEKIEGVTLFVKLMEES